MIELIIGVGIVSFILIYLANSLEQDHFLLKLFFILFAMTFLMLIPRATLEDNCTSQLANETVKGNFTSYEYTQVCTPMNNTGTDNTFWYTFLGLYIILWIYTIVKYLQHLFNKMQQEVKQS